MTENRPSEKELDRRLANVRTAMQDRGFDGLVVADPSNIYYLSGYNAWSFYTPQFLYVPMEGEPVLAMREMDARGAHRTASRFTDGILGYPEHLVHRPDAHPGAWLAEQLRALGHARPQRVGYEGDAHFFSVRTFLGLLDGLPEWQLQESAELVNWVRLVKSDYEIDLLRRAGLVASEVMRTAIEAITEGTPVNEVAAAVAAAQAAGTADADGDYPAFVPMFPRGEGADTPHLTWTADKIAAGETVSIEIAGVHRRYHAPLARAVTLGRPSTDLDRLAGATVEGLNAALEAMRPGNTPADVTAAWNKVLSRHGLEKRSRLGYSIGIGFPPDWGERTVSIRAEDTTELRENMTFHVIAGMWMTGYGFEVSESIRVTANAPEVLTNAPRALIVKEN
ncbi:ectoine hydrolase [Mycobacterium frederiksbergense]|uniref:Ectoine hydrolase n=1 Tax=Mycolicibacterium frederiksbergense TaxID=117567 RepID=A0ABT6L0F1_9MYCO|nr:Xaa-Pro peptidase family protein [Mycolicibacterium frederiksbergense]MDH6195515.1 ectoine hydrolase [Mycolicibacterium frederiksbergense]